MGEGMANRGCGRVHRPWAGALPRRVVAIVNPSAGRGLSLPLTHELAGLFARNGVRLATAMTTRPGQASDLAAAASGQADLLIVVGGDGTVNEVLQGVQPDRPAVLIVPAGTENVLAKQLGLSRSPRKLWRVIQDGVAVRFDLGLAAGRRFSMLASAGFDAAVVHDLHATRSGTISHLSYFWPTWRCFWKHDWPPVRVIVDGEEFFCGRGMIFVCNISRYAMGLRICREALPTDGQLDVCVLACRGRWGLIRWAAAAVVGWHPRLYGYKQTRARSVRLVSVGAMPLEVDGDPAGVLPVQIDVLPAAASLLCSRKAIPRIAGNGPGAVAAACAI